MAIADIKHGILSFEDIAAMASQTQSLMKGHQLGSEDSVLVAIAPSPLLYGIICGLMGHGIRIIFIEPWLSIEKIDHVIKETKPKVFLTSALGKIWGARSKAIRNIHQWLTPSDILKMPKSQFEIREVNSDHHAFIVFSSGTTGAPKGVIRTHAYMQNIYDVFTTNEPQDFDSPDLIIFPNVALFHLATGRGSIIVPQKWSQKNLSKVLELCERFKPQTVSTGPAFLKTLIDLDILTKFKSLERIVIGGALTDCWLLEKTFELLPKCRFLHIYGGSEAEPVAIMNAKEAVIKSRERGYFQTLCLGEPIPQIQCKNKDGVLWVSGPNVAGEYIGHPDENKGIKERDAEGKLWHSMGDRVKAEQGVLWFGGREAQVPADFELEQRVYAELGSSKSFIYRDREEITLYGEGITSSISKLRSTFPQIHHFQETKIIRDKRHRSRIDRKKSLPKKSGSSMKRFMTYLNERSPLPAITFLAAGIGISAMAMRQSIDWPFLLMGVVLNNLLFIQMRLGDELKDYENDKIINPTRPLPRGLYTTNEVFSLLVKFFVLLLVAGILISSFLSMWGGVSLLIAAVFSWLMYKEFYVSHELDKSPMIYAVTHQIIVFPLFAWLGLTYDSSLIHESIFQGWLLANFGASFTFEICRKLDPKAHKLAKTYAHHYGRPTTVLIITVFLAISAVGAAWAGYLLYSLPFLILLLLSVLFWSRTPEKFKLPAGLSALSSTVILWAPAIMWLIQSWRA